MENAKKILLIDDSALMRRMLYDILNSDKRFEVAGYASDGLTALELLEHKSFDAVVLDINMPKMDGLQLLRELRRRKIRARVMILSSYTYEGAKTLMDALALGALDFMHKPNALAGWSMDYYREMFLQTLDTVANGAYPDFDDTEESAHVHKAAQTARAGALQSPRAETAQSSRAEAAQIPTGGVVSGTKIVAIASSTGGPKALQSVIPRLPEGLDAPVLLVQHMPKGFTLSLAERLDELSSVRVKEAAEGEELVKGTVYVSMGGKHMKVRKVPGGRHVICYTDEPMREGVKPCANYMYESLMDSGFSSVICVVMTGMGADGTSGIASLKMSKSTYVIAQNQETSTVYGMPKSVVHAGLADTELPLEQIAQEIVRQVGER